VSLHIITMYPLLQWHFNYGDRISNRLFRSLIDHWTWQVFPNLARNATDISILILWNYMRIRVGVKEQLLYKTTHPSLFCGGCVFVSVFQIISMISALGWWDTHTHRPDVFQMANVSLCSAQVFLFAVLLITTFYHIVLAGDKGWLQPSWERPIPQILQPNRQCTRDRCGTGSKLLCLFAVPIPSVNKPLYFSLSSQQWYWNMSLLLMKIV